MEPQFGWPCVTGVGTLEDGRRAQRGALRKTERLTPDLQEIMSAADKPKVVDAAGVLLATLTATAETLKASIASRVASR